ncbi:MAG TPA: hypothetical protein VIN59_01540, partial [Alphaproteobacteria bacterium]
TYANAGVDIATTSIELTDLVTHNPRAEGGWLSNTAKCLFGDDKSITFQHHDPYDFKGNVTALVCRVF